MVRQAGWWKSPSLALEHSWVQSGWWRRCRVIATWWGGSMGEKQQLKPPSFVPSYFQHIQLPFLISRAHKMLYWSWSPNTPALIAGSTEASDIWSWQGPGNVSVTNTRKKDAATADATFERVRFWFLWLREIKSNSGDVNTAALPTKPSEDFFFLFSAHSRKKRERARISTKPLRLRALFTSCLSPVYRLALLLFYRSKISFLFQVVHCMAIRGTVVVLPLFNCSLQGLLACECVTSPLGLCCSFLSWVKPFSRLDRVSVLVFLVGVFSVVWSTRSI